MAGATGDPDLSPLAQWRQGDCSFDLKGSVVADLPDGPDEPFSPFLEDAEGIVLLSQTCDVVRPDDPLAAVIVAPLIKVENDVWRAAERGMRPRLAAVPVGEGKCLVADLSRAFSITKQFLASLKRTPGFRRPEDAARFALAIERMFGRFAFPDGFNETVSRLRKRIFGNHSKSDSPIGACYRSIYQIRVRAAPSWDDPNAEISFIFILEDNLETGLQEVDGEINLQIGKMTLPGNLRWADPRYKIGSLDELSARDIVESQLLDILIVSAPT